MPVYQCSALHPPYTKIGTRQNAAGTKMTLFMKKNVSDNLSVAVSFYFPKSLKMILTELTPFQNAPPSILQFLLNLRPMLQNF
jgi:hypothetical protein